MSFTLILKSSLWKFFDRHHELVDRYGVSDLAYDTGFVCNVIFLSDFYLVCDNYWTLTNTLSNTKGIACGTETAFTSGASEFTPGPSI